jgi:putative membrane protein insertion efficiency factor
MHCMETAIIKMVRQYQKWAPQSLRNTCRFEPRCSCYMILAVEKHGAFRGVLLGVRRIFRCHQPNGGVDYP